MIHPEESATRDFGFQATSICRQPATAGFGPQPGPQLPLGLSSLDTLDDGTLRFPGPGPTAGIEWRIASSPSLTICGQNAKIIRWAPLSPVAEARSSTNAQIPGQDREGLCEAIINVGKYDGGQRGARGSLGRRRASSWGVGFHCRTQHPMPF